ncbi:hypothetical protein [Borreliella americana]|nr:hypothetical protein [Borreliella americana]MCD2332763.1 hypothetical protein [Borreliella americana]
MNRFGYEIGHVPGYDKRFRSDIVLTRKVSKIKTSNIIFHMDLIITGD